MASAELRELEEKLSGAKNKMNHSVRLSWLRDTSNKRVKNIVNGYPISNSDFATVEEFEVSSIASYEKSLIQLANADFEIE
ncbi:hypothetical protein BYT27DRAFT_7263641 [Phlegmacium glaucopus]|nr:hypothetical protein BYT27DRAFT_7263641 [Phlegmacium glaucopus]